MVGVLVGLYLIFVYMPKNKNDSTINPFQPSDAFYRETSHLICRANQMTGFYVKGNTGLKWVNLGSANNK